MYFNLLKMFLLNLLFIHLPFVKLLVDVVCTQFCFLACFCFFFNIYY